MKKIPMFILAVLCFTGIYAQTSDQMKIHAAMNEQVNAWNSGNMERYMDTYWRSDSLMFIGKSGVTYGWDNTLKNYKRGYPDTAAMGKLDFTLISVKRLSVLYYSVVGKWHLKRTVGDLDGAFTLLFKKIKKKWVIVQDHSS